MKTIGMQLIAMALLLVIGCAVGWHAGRYPLLHTIKTHEGKASIGFLLKSGRTVYVSQSMDQCGVTMSLSDPKTLRIEDVSRLDECEGKE